MTGLPHPAADGWQRADSGGMEGDMTDYHEGLPVLPPSKAASVTDRLRIQIIGVRAGWAAWAARETDAAREAGGDAAANERWWHLMTVDTVLRSAEAQLETAIEAMGKEGTT